MVWCVRSGADDELRIELAVTLRNFHVERSNEGLAGSHAPDEHGVARPLQLHAHGRVHRPRRGVGHWQDHAHSAVRPRLYLEQEIDAGAGSRRVGRTFHYKRARNDGARGAAGVRDGERRRRRSRAGP